uniref:TonB-dependent receptor n=1 Tax=uncultured Caulobacter sp. TaxID=158749 RepID=UPI0025ED7663|nr:TonB-dependent receptor [uncultured Caulobacter sp.]
MNKNTRIARHLSRAMLLGTTASCLMWGVGAAAQTDQSSSAEVEEVVVTGFRSSLEKALVLKRESTGAVDSIVAEDIAKFPDNNLAEAIQRVPGVSITRNAGEGKSISVRGLSEEFTRVRINGVEAQATTAATAGGVNRGRGFDFNVFASELFSRIDVRKTAQAEVEEGSLGATVDLHTGRPFDFSGLTIAGSVKGSYNDLSRDYDPRAAVLISNRFADDTLGVLVSAAYSERGIVQMGGSTSQFQEGNADGGWCDPVARPTLCAGTNVADYNLASQKTTRYARFLTYQNYDMQTKRLGLTGAVQWRPSNRTEAVLDVLYSRFDGRRDSRQISAIGFSRNASNGGKPEIVIRDIDVDSNGTIVAGLFDNVDLRSENYLEEFRTNFFQSTLNISHEFSDRFSVTGLLGYTNNKFDQPLAYTTQMDRINSDNYSYDLRGDPLLPKISYGFDVADPNSWYIGPRVTVPGGVGPTGPEIRIATNANTNRFKVAQIDPKFVVNDSLTLKAGASYRVADFIASGKRPVSTTDLSAIPGGLSMSQVTQRFCGLKGLNVPAGTPTCWASPDRDAIAKAYGVFSNTGRFEMSESFASARGENRSVKEETLGGYLQADFKLDVGGLPVRGDVGVRYVKTDQQSVFYSTVPTTVDPSGFVLTTVKRSYDNVLPSLNLVVEPVQNLLVRASAAEVMSRPPLASLSSAVSVSVAGGNRSVSTGNPFLEPYKARTYDASIEWYPKRGTILSAAVFKKNISTYVQRITVVAPYSSTGLPASLLQGTGANTTDDFSVSNVVNTPGGTLEGFELNYQQQLTFLPGALRDLGILANYTRVKSQIDYFLTTTAGSGTVKRDLLNLSPNAYNVTLYYEKGPFQARTSVAYRDRFLTAVPASYNVDVAGKKPTTFVDASASYQVTDAMALSVEALNLTNERDVYYTDSTAERLTEGFLGGRQFIVGLRFNF